MSLVHYHPIRKMRNMTDQFDRIFTGIDRIERKMIPVNITEDDDQYIITAEIPGFTSEEIDIEVKRDGITIVAEHVNESVADDENNDNAEKTDEPKLIYSEIRTQKMIRRLSFGKELEAKDASSSLDNGILTITLPKAEKEKPVKLVPQTN